MAFGLTAVAGLEVGHFTDTRRPTGCTVVIARDGAVAGVDVRGASPGTRETELLDPVNAIDKVHAIVLAGGSAFGLDAASGVMRWLDERGIGATIAAPPGDSAPPPFVVPIVPAAILFDLWVGDARIRPDAAGFDTTMGEFILRYEDARRATSPADAVLEFFQSVYEAGAERANWNRALLERNIAEGAHR